MLSHMILSTFFEEPPTRNKLRRHESKFNLLVEDINNVLNFHKILNIQTTINDDTFRDGHSTQNRGENIKFVNHKGDSNETH